MIKGIASFTTKIILALLAGCSLALVILQRDTRFKTIAETQIKAFFNNSFEAELEGTLSDVNLIFPSITIKDMVVTPAEGFHGWSWYARQGTVSFSWLTFLLTGKVALHIVLEDFQADSLVENQRLCAEHHLRRLFSPPEVQVPAFLKTLHIRRGVFKATDPVYNVQAILNTHVDMKKINQVARTNFYSTSGTVTYNTQCIMRNIIGSLFVQVSDKDDTLVYKATTSLSFDVPALDAPACFVQGSWHHDHGQFSLHNDDRTFTIDPLTIQDHDVLGVVRIPLSLLSTYMPLGVNGLQGSCTAQIHTNYADIYKTQADISLKQCSYQGFNCDATHITVDSASKGFRGTVDIAVTPTLHLSGAWAYDNNQGGSLDISNTSSIQIPGLAYWSIKPNDIKVQASMPTQNHATASFELQACHTLLGTVVKSSGSLLKEDSVITVTGDIEHKKYDIKLTTNPFSIEHLNYYDGSTALATCTSAQGETKALINYALIRSLLPEAFKDELHGEGMITINAHHDADVVRGTIALSQGVIKLPKLYNFINSFKASLLYDVQEKKLTFADVVCGLHRGSIVSSRSVIGFNDAYAINFVHIPVLFDSCFVSWQKDLFTIVSGHLVYKRKDKSSELKGTLIADKSQLKGNLFSPELQRSLLYSPVSSQTQASDVALDLHVMSRSPLHVKTAFLNAQAHVDIAIKGNIGSPHIAGIIDVPSGELKFPYKPLVISHGKIFLVPEAPDDPLIELTAKNKIKKYSVGMHISGSLQDPHIYFDSSPVLSEQQVISLLLAGSEESSFNLLMPTLVMQNIQTIIFGPAQTDSKLTTYFNNLFKPLAAVRIVPRFTDESGRGGLRGAIEVSVNDRLTGLIQKNFSLPEDTVFEVDYAISDDVSVRGIKDEHGDLGGELEMRWKF